MIGSRPGASGAERASGGTQALRLLVLDGSYDLDTIRKLGLQQPVLSRDLNGFFDHVWSVHQFGDVSRRPVLTGTPEWVELAPRHTFIQAKPGRFALLRPLVAVNFLLAQISLLFSLVALVRRERIAIVRAGCPLYVGLLGWAVARLTGTRFMIRVNGNYDKLRATTGTAVYPRLIGNKALEKKIEQFVLGRADFVVGPNEDNVGYAINNGAAADRTEIIPYGNLLSPKHLEPPEERGVDQPLFDRLRVEPKRFLLCVARLQAIKFPGDPIRVLARLRDKGHDLSLVLAGEGPMRAELELLASELGVADHVRFTGNLTQDALAQLYAHAAVVVSPHTGRALSEAAFGAAPIAAYDVDWQAEVIQTGKTGELVPVHDVQALADATEKLLVDRDYARKMGGRVRKRALNMLEPERLNELEREAYRKVLTSA